MLTMARFRQVALAEGISFLVLLGIAMPLKYLAGMPMAVRVAGLVHGILFILYSVGVARYVFGGRWSWMRGAETMVLGVLPFGTFVLERRLRREEAQPPPAGDTRTNTSSSST